MGKVSLWRLFGVGVMSVLLWVGMFAHAAPKPTDQQYRVMMDSYTQDAEAMSGFLNSYDSHVEVWGDPSLYLPFTNKLYVNITDNLKRQAGSLLESYAQIDKLNHADAVTIWARNGLPQKAVKGGSVPDVHYFKDIRNGNFTKLKSDAIARAGVRNPDIAATKDSAYKGLYAEFDKKIKGFHDSLSQLVYKLFQLSSETGNPDGVRPRDGIGKGEYDLKLVARDIIRQYGRLASVNKHLADGSIVNTGLDTEVMVPRFFDGLSLEQIKHIAAGDFTFLDNTVRDSIRVAKALASAAIAKGEPDPPDLDFSIRWYYRQLSDMKTAEDSMLNLLRKHGADVSSYSADASTAFESAEAMRSSFANEAAKALDTVAEYHPALSDSLQMASNVTRDALLEYSIKNSRPPDYMVRRAKFTREDFSGLTADQSTAAVEDILEKSYQEMLRSSRLVIAIGKHGSDIGEDVLPSYNRLQFRLYQQAAKLRSLYLEYDKVSSEKAGRWLESKLIDGRFESVSFDVLKRSFAEPRISYRLPANFSKERRERIIAERAVVESQLRQLKDVLDQMQAIKEKYDPLFQKDAMLQFDGRSSGSDSSATLANMRRNFDLLEQRAKIYDFVIHRGKDSLFTRDIQAGTWLWDQVSDIRWPRLNGQMHLTARGNRPPPLPPKPVPGRSEASGPIAGGQRRMPSASEIELARMLDRRVRGVERAGSFEYSGLFYAPDSEDREVYLRRIGGDIRSLYLAEAEVESLNKGNSLHGDTGKSGGLAKARKEAAKGFNDLAERVEADVSSFLSRYSDEHNFADLYDVGFGSMRMHYRYPADGEGYLSSPARVSKSPQDYEASPRPESGRTELQVEDIRRSLISRLRQAEASVHEALNKIQNVKEIYTRKGELSLDQMNERVSDYNTAVREVMASRQRLFIHMDELARSDANALDFISYEDVFKSVAIRKQMLTVDEILESEFDIDFRSIIMNKTGVVDSGGGVSGLDFPGGGSADGGIFGVGEFGGLFDVNWFGSVGDDTLLSGEDLFTRELRGLIDRIVESRTSMEINSRIMDTWKSDVDVDSELGFVRQIWNEERFKLEFVYKARLARLMNHAMEHSEYFHDSIGRLDIKKLGGSILDIIEEHPTGARTYLLSYTGFELSEPDWAGPEFTVRTGAEGIERDSMFKFGEISLQSEPLAMPEEEFVSHDVARARSVYVSRRQVYSSMVEYWTSRDLVGRSGLAVARDDVSGTMNDYLNARRELFSLDPNAAVWAEHVGNTTELLPHADVDEAIFGKKGRMAELAAVEPNVDTPNLLRIEAEAVSGGGVSQRPARFGFRRVNATERIRRSVAFAEEETPSDPEYVLEADLRDGVGEFPPGATSADYLAGGAGATGGHTTAGGRAEDPYLPMPRRPAPPPPRAGESGPFSTPGSGGGRRGPGYHVLDGGDDSGGAVVPGDSGVAPADGGASGPYEKMAIGLDRVRQLGLDLQGRVLDPVLGRPPVPARPDVVRPPVPPRRGVSGPPLPPRGSHPAPPSRLGVDGDGGGTKIEQAIMALESMDVQTIARYRSAALERLMESYRGSYYMKDGSATDLGAPRAMPEFARMARQGYIKYLRSLPTPTWNDQRSALRNEFKDFVQFDQEVANAPPSAGVNAPDRFFAYSSPGSPRAAWRASPQFGQYLGAGDTFVSADTMIVDNSPFGAARAFAEVLKSGNGDGRLVVYEIQNKDFGQFDRVSEAGSGARSKWGLKKQSTINPDELGGGVARSLGAKLARLRATKESGGSGGYIGEMIKARERSSGVSRVFRLIQDGVFGTDAASGGVPKVVTELEGVPEEVFGTSMSDELAFVGVDKSAFTRGTAFKVIKIQDKRIRFRFYRKPLQGTDEAQTVLGGQEGLVGFDEVLEIKRVVLRPRSSVNSGEEVWVSRNRGTEGPRLVSVDSQWEDLDALGVKKGFAVQCE